MNPDDVMDLIKDVSARIIEPRFRALGSGDVGTKGPGDFVTVADRQADHRAARARQKRDHAHSVTRPRLEWAQAPRAARSVLQAASRASCRRGTRAGR